MRRFGSWMLLGIACWGMGFGLMGPFVSRAAAAGLEARAAGLVRKKAFARAAVAYEEIARTKPHEAGRALGPLYAALGWNEKAFRFYSKMVRRFPDRAWYWYCLGYAARASGRWSRAVGAYRRALRLAPKDPSIWYGLAVSLAGAGRRRKAAHALQTYLRSEKRAWARPWVNKARKLLATLRPARNSDGKGHAPAAAASRGAARAPARTRPPVRDRQVLLYVAKVLHVLESGRVDDAQKLGWQGIGKYPHSGACYLVLAKVLERAGKWNRAMGVLRLGLRRVPSFPAGRLGIARLALDHGMADEAHLNLSVLARHPPSSRGLLDQAAALAERMGCRDWQKRFLRARPAGVPRAAVANHSLPAPGRAGGPAARRRAARPGVGAPTRPMPTLSQSEVAVLEGLLRARKCSVLVKEAERRLVKHPKSYMLLVLSAEAMLCLGKDLRGALTRALRAARSAPGRFEAWRVAGLVAVRLRGRKAARTYLQRYLDLASSVPSQRSRVAFVRALIKSLK